MSNQEIITSQDGLGGVYTEFEVGDAMQQSAAGTQRNQRVMSGGFRPGRLLKEKVGGRDAVTGGGLRKNTIVSSDDHCNGR